MGECRQALRSPQATKSSATCYISKPVKPVREEPVRGSSESLRSGRAAAAAY